MSESDGDNAMLWFNLIGACLVVGLLGTFFWLNGGGFLRLMMSFLAPGVMAPPH